LNSRVVAPDITFQKIQLNSKNETKIKPIYSICISIQISKWNPYEGIIKKLFLICPNFGLLVRTNIIQVVQERPSPKSKQHKSYEDKQNEPTNYNLLNLTVNEANEQSKATRRHNSVGLCCNGPQICYG